MKLNVGTREDDTPYMLSALDIGMNISEMFGRSEEWVALCDKSPALARAFGEVHFALDEEDPQYLSYFIHEIDKNSDALEVIQDDDDLSYPYLTAKRLLALCETDDSKPAKPPVRLDWDLDLDQPKATTAEAVSEWAQAAGSDPHRIGKQWLLTDYDTVVRNPHYTGPAQPHPDDEPARSLVASVSYSWDDIQCWLGERENDPDSPFDAPFAGHVWTPEQQADVMATLQEYLEMHVYESFGRTLYVEALDAEWEKIK